MDEHEQERVLEQIRRDQAINSETAAEEADSSTFETTTETFNPRKTMDEMLLQFIDADTLNLSKTPQDVAHDRLIKISKHIKNMLRKWDNYTYTIATTSNKHSAGESWGVQADDK